MPAVPSDIPAELFIRLAALDARCDCFMARETQYRSLIKSIDGSPDREAWSTVRSSSTTPTRRAWRVRINLRDAEYFSMTSYVDASEPTLADALAKAIEEAERRGWHKSAES